MLKGLVRIAENEYVQLLANEDDIIKMRVSDGYSGGDERDYGVFRDYINKNVIVVESSGYGKNHYVNADEQINYILFSDMSAEERFKVCNALTEKENVIYIKADDGKDANISIDDKLIGTCGIDIFNMRDCEILFRILHEKLSGE